MLYLPYPKMWLSKFAGQSTIPRDTMTLRFFRTIATSAVHEFAPVCAVVGGMLAQDILKALSAREAPIANFFTFDGNTGSGAVVRMNML